MLNIMLKNNSDESQSDFEDPFIETLETSETCGQSFGQKGDLNSVYFYTSLEHKELSEAFKPHGYEVICF